MSGQKANITAVHGTATVHGVGVEIAFNSSGGAAEWIMLMPIDRNGGSVPTVDGRGPYRVANPAQLAAASFRAHSGRIPIDENHSTDLAAPRGEPAPARGWAVELQARADGIYGRVEWSASGAALMSEKAYRYISPVMVHDKDFNVLDMPRASLTNTPNLIGMAALNSTETNMDLLAQLRKALGLADDADQDAVIAKVKEAFGNTTAMQSVALAAGLAKDAAGDAIVAAVKKLKTSTSLASIAKAAGLKDDADEAAIVTAVTALASATPDQVKALQTELASVTTQLNSLSAQTAKDKATAYIDGEIAKGRVGLGGAMREHYIARHAASPTEAAAVAKEVSAMPIVPPGTITFNNAPAATGGDTDPVALASAAADYQKKQAAAGVTIDFASAVTAVAAQQQQAAK